MRKYKIYKLRKYIYYKVIFICLIIIFRHTPDLSVYYYVYIFIYMYVYFMYIFTLELSLVNFITN